MLKLLSFFLLVCISFLNADDKVEIYATSMESQGDIVKAHGEVMVIYKDYYLSAKEAVYDKSSGELELFGNIRATQGKEYKLLGDRAKLNIEKKERSFKPFFMLENSSNVWLCGDEGITNDKDIDIESGVMSGCDPTDPLWTMEFSSSSYNSDTKWLNLYNTRIYIYDIPVFYTPYFGYSLDTTRRTGLLQPGIGISDKEGLFFEQPFYIAEQNWWDLEFKPQTRTSRGYGIYSTFRFVDSWISKGEFTAGYFKEKPSYYETNNLAHDTHYGLKFNYENSDFINQLFGSSLQGQSGLYVDANNMNDVDYINLASNDTTQNATSTQLLSRVNMFYNTDKNYFASYFKYYKDLTLEKNEETLQKLPTFQYHYYLDSLFGNHLLYNFDLQKNNIHRDINKKVVQTNLNIPVTLQTTLFDEYLNISYKAQVYGQHSSFSGDEDTPTGIYNDGIFLRNYNVLQASTQLTKAYEDFTHVVGFGATYTLNGSQSRTWFYEDNKEFCSEAVNKSSAQCEFYNISGVQEYLQLSFSQYLYDIAGAQKIHHRVAQNIAYEEKTSLGELENELVYQITSNINLYSNAFYNYDENSLSKFFNQISYNAYGFNISLSHLYKDTFFEATDISSPYTSYITSSASYTYDSHYSYNVRFDYDMEYALKKSAEIGFMYKKRCWEFGLRYVENNRPVLAQDSSSSVYDRYLYFTIVLKPIMAPGTQSSNFAARLPDNLRGL